MNIRAIMTAEPLRLRADETIGRAVELVRILSSWDAIAAVAGCRG